MGRLVLICRLAWRDLRRRRAETAALLVAITAATTTLTLGLALHGVTSHPYQQTRQATAGPDVVASYVNLPPMPSGDGPRAGLAGLSALVHAPGVTGHGGPYPFGWATLRVHGLTAGVLAEGRGSRSAAVDRPKLTAGSWVRPGGVVLERGFANALGVSAGDRISLDGRSFLVAGIAVTAAMTPYPNVPDDVDASPFPSSDIGLIWSTPAAVRSFATRTLPLSYIVNLRLADPAAAAGFASAHSSEVLTVTAWQSIADQYAKTIAVIQAAMLVGSTLLALLAVASVAVLVGGRMAEQTRRVGLLKAAGGTPGLVAAVLLAEHVAVALTAAAVGLVLGRLAAPLLTSPSASLIGTSGPPGLTPQDAALAVAVALIVAVAAAFVPALRAARTSTVSALADAARAPGRRARVITFSALLPVPLLLGLRLAARRPRRLILSTFSVAITATMIVALLTVTARQSMVASGLGQFSSLDNPRHDRVDQVLGVITVMLVILAAVNAMFIAWATVTDSRHPSALARALGATPQQVSLAVSAAQVLPGAAGGLIGIPAGIGLVAAVGSLSTLPSGWWLAAVAVVTPLVVAGLTTVPARAGARRSVAEILQAELA